MDALLAATPTLRLTPPFPFFPRAQGLCLQPVRHSPHEPLCLVRRGQLPEGVGGGQGRATAEHLAAVRLGVEHVGAVRCVWWALLAVFCPLTHVSPPLLFRQRQRRRHCGLRRRHCPHLYARRRQGRTLASPPPFASQVPPPLVSHAPVLFALTLRCPVPRATTR